MRHKKLASIVAISAILFSSTGPTAFAYGSNELVRISLSPIGADPNASSLSPSLSSDGRLVVFDSYATNLVDINVPVVPQAYATGLADGVTELVSQNSDGEVANDYAQDVSTAGDGRFVVFTSGATNLVAYPGTPRSQVFIRDRLLGTTELASVNSQGVAGDGFSGSPTVSADGRYVTFWSESRNLGGTPYWRVYLRDQVEGTTIPIPVPAPVGSKVYTLNAAISDDGSAVAFRSQTLDANGNPLTNNQAMLYSTVTGQTVEVSVSSSGAPANADSVPYGISANGRFVAFMSRSTNLASMSGYQLEQVYLHDVVTGLTELVSTENLGRGLISGFPSVSGDGRFVTYSSGFGNGTQSIVQRDRETGAVSTIAESGIRWGSKPVARQDASGAFVVFESDVSLVESDQNASRDIYVVGASDASAPVVTGSLDREPNQNGWSQIGTIVRWSVSDEEPSSGLVVLPSDITLLSEGKDQVITSSPACDGAGNCDTGAITVSVDSTPPLLSPMRISPDGENDWFRDDVIFSWSCLDELSGLSGSCPTSSVIEGEGVGLSAAVSLSDLADNTSTVSTPPVNIDRTSPSTSIEFGGTGSASGVVGLYASDNLSGVRETFYSLDGGPVQEGGLPRVRLTLGVCSVYAAVAVL